MRSFNFNRLAQRPWAYVQRRFISGVRWVGHAQTAYLSLSQGEAQIVRRFVEKYITKHCATTGLDLAGAEIAEITSPGHHGGRYPQEPFHWTFLVKDANGALLPTTNPYTGRQTYRHHLHIPGVTNPADLRALAAAEAAAEAETMLEPKVQGATPQGSSSTHR